MAIQLNKREKIGIFVAVGVLCVFIFMQFVITPFIEKRDRLSKNIQIKTSDLEEMIRLKSEYDTLKKQSDLSKAQFAKRKRGFTLFSFLDKLAGQAKLKDRITYMKPSSSTQKNSPYKISTVEMKLQGVTLKQLVPYLHMVETSENMVKIKRLSISKAGKEVGFIDAVLQVETLET
jgi:general secretion pathway protein M